MNFIPITATNYFAVKEIYTEGIESGIATFETQAPPWMTWDNAHLHFARIALEVNEKIVGWAALSPVSSRCVYGGVAEVSVYIGTAFHGHGFGSKLMQKLIHESEKNKIWTLQSSVFAENIASIKLHEKCGFRQVGYREKIGKLDGVWHNTILLEKRSSQFQNTH